MADAAAICSACQGAPRPEAEDPRGQHDLRPYGVGGALICWLCAQQPERRAETGRQMRAHQDAAYAASDVVMITPAEGYVPIGGKRQ